LWVLEAAGGARWPFLPHRVETTKLAGGADGVKSSTDPAVAQQLLDKIDEIAKIFWETKQG
jgi:hypothetical protein